MTDELRASLGAGPAGPPARRERLLRLARLLPPLMVGFALGIAVEVGAALMLYSGLGLLSAAGFILGVALAALAAGVWAGMPDAQAEQPSSIGRWVAAGASLLFAAIYASLWEHAPLLRSSPAGRAGAVLLMVAWPSYSLGALLVTLGVRIGRANAEWSAAGAAYPAQLDPPTAVSAGSAVAALVGAALGVAWAGVRLIPRLPAGYVLVGVALVIALVGLLEARRTFYAERSGPMRGKSAIVTGVGARGQVGYALAEALLRAGARVLVTGHSPEVGVLAQELAAGGGDVVALPADLTDEAAVAAVVEAARAHLGGLDVLVNVAGGLSVIKPLAETSDEEWARELDRNARTAFLMCRAALPLLRASRGTIINFASPAGIRAKASLGAYSAAKAAVVALTRALALEEGKNGVRVNAIAPGMIDTAQNRRQASEASTPEVTAADREVRNVNRRQAGEASTPEVTAADRQVSNVNRRQAGEASTPEVTAADRQVRNVNVEGARDPSAVRWVTRQQIADVVLFLAGEAGSGISGETIHVLGGAAE